MLCLFNRLLSTKKWKVNHKVTMKAFFAFRSFLYLKKRLKNFRKQFKKESTPTGFEPMPPTESRFLVCRLNHSATVSYAKSPLISCFPTTEFIVEKEVFSRKIFLIYFNHPRLLFILLTDFLLKQYLVFLISLWKSQKIIETHKKNHFENLFDFIKTCRTPLPFCCFCLPLRLLRWAQWQRQRQQRHPKVSKGNSCKTHSRIAVLCLRCEEPTSSWRMHYNMMQI